MVFLYSEPIVRDNDFKTKLIAANSPLDLQIEYKQISQGLKNTNRQFTIMKEAVNNESLIQVVQKNPQIIHISCHGDFDKTGSEQFYLAFEDKDTGKEHKVT